MIQVCRTEIADCVEDAFAEAPLSPSGLIHYAAEHGARKPVLETLGRLHRDQYQSLRDLWDELAEIPIER